MTTKGLILKRTEAVFDQRGFAASGIDRLAEAAGVSTRTLYKHVGSKNALVESVLLERQTRFFARLSGATLHELFDSLEGWVGEEGARGCFFLRAEAENGDQLPGISDAVREYHTLLADFVAKAVRAELGADNPELEEQILVLFEGATSAATYRGSAAVRAASSAAEMLLQTASSLQPHSTINRK